MGHTQSDVGDTHKGTHIHEVDTWLPITDMCMYLFTM